MTGYRIGSLNLPAKECAYLRALVRLFSYAEPGRWSYVDEAPFDALVMHPDLAGTHVADLQGYGGSVLKLVRQRRGGDELDYPIRADQLREWLRSWVAPASAPAPAARLAQHAAIAAPARFQLRRWPSAPLLRGNGGRIRMATLISKHAFSVAELAGKSGLKVSVCAEFIEVLRDAGLLLTVTGSSAAAAAPADGASPKAGLLASLRRRLGL